MKPMDVDCMLCFFQLVLKLALVFIYICMHVVDSNFGGVLPLFSLPPIILEDLYTLAMGGDVVTTDHDSKIQILLLIIHFIFKFIAIDLRIRIIYISI